MAMDDAEKTLKSLCEKVDMMSENFDRLARRLQIESERITQCDAKHTKKRWFYSIFLPAMAGATGGIAAAILLQVAA